MSPMQKRYIWLMGSYAHCQMFQGQGKRSRKLKYAVDGDELIIFGYSMPPYFMLGRWLKKGQAPNSYSLTDEGERAFNMLLSKGGISSDEFDLVKLKA